MGCGSSNNTSVPNPKLTPNFKEKPKFEESSKSLLKQFLTNEVWDQCKDRIDQHGYTFSQLINSGIKNQDSSCGVYAGSMDSYKTFSPLLDKVIEKYHSHGPTSSHKSNWNVSDLKITDLDPEGQYCQSTRIRVARNLAAFPLGTHISQDQRKAVEDIAKSAFAEFVGELDGKYYPLLGMDNQTQKQLIQDHFLFKQGDRFLDACGLNRNWPEGRGIFHNSQKTFLVWVNEEDQFRIISMQKGGDIKQVFARLAKAQQEIEKHAKFAYNDHLGYITSCPTNLGTGLRASIHVRLPKLMRFKEQFEQIANKYNVQIRGIDGEHSESPEGIFDISNKRRLGVSEVELVMDMYNGVKAMIDAEKALPDSFEVTSTVKPSFPENCKSLLKKHLTDAIWSQLRLEKDEKGFTFCQMINSGVMNPDSSIGVYSGSPDSYTKFAPFLDKIIQDYHGHAPSAQHVSSWDVNELSSIQNLDPENKYCVSTRIRVARNLEGFPLVTHINKAQRKEVEGHAKKAFESFDAELKGTYYSLESMNEKDKKSLIEDHFLFKEGDRFLKAAGITRDWPEGRGIFHNEQKTFLVWVNEEDQFRIISMQNGGDIKAVFVRLAKAQEQMEKQAKFAFNNHIGYVTTCPTNLGTGLRASIHVKLPKLSSNWKKFEAIAAKHHVQIRGIDGEHSVSKNAIYDISNKRRLGIKETQLVMDMYEGVKEMIEAEKSMQDPFQEFQWQGEEYPPFQASNNCLLKKHMTAEIWQQYKTAHDSTGFSFRQCINSGVKYDSSTGIYAGSEESYKSFELVFNPIIEDYHKHKLANKHKSNWNVDDLKIGNLDPENRFCVSTRIRVARNLKGFQLGTCISKESRKEVEAKALQAFYTFDDDLAGKYYALGNLTPDERKKLIDDHFLFKEGDKYLQSSGLNRDWPDARGIFHNKDKTFLVWVNEEDQFRIISMQPGGDIKAVFARLARAQSAIEKINKFASTEQHGYITTCPTNIGTGLRASIHVKLPKLSKKKDMFEKIASDHNVQIRGVDGEHSESKDGIFDISNKRRLGISEVELVMDMYNGVKAMIDAEQSLPNEVPSESKPKFTSESKSSLKKYLTDQVWESLKLEKDSTGYSFCQLINSGVVNQDSSMGVYAGSEDSYTKFRQLLDPIIQEYHGHGPDAQHKSDWDVSKLNIEALDKRYCVSTRIRVARNLQGFPLGTQVTKEERKQIEQKAMDAFKTFDAELKGQFYSLEGMKPEIKKQLIEDHFLFKMGDRFLEACGLTRDWPSGRGIFHNDAKTFLVWVNEEDQFRIISMQKGGDIKAVFARLAQAQEKIEAQAKFAHNGHLGYITTCPSNLGTGLRASIHVRLPKLSQNWSELEKIAQKHNVQIRGIDGEHSESPNGVYDISNRRRLGISEVELVMDMYNGVKEMIEAEKKLPDPFDKFQYNGMALPTIQTEKPCMLKEFLDEDIWGRYKNKCDYFGFQFRQAINSGVKNPDSSIGVYAGSMSSYKSFHKMFDKIIDKYHGHKPDAKHQSSWDVTELNITQDVDPDGTYALSTRIRVARNFDKYPFGTFISPNHRKEVETIAQQVFNAFTGELKGTYYSLKTMTDKQKKQLMEDHFLFQQGDRFLEAAGLSRDWPDSRGIFHNVTKTFLVWVNEEDHLRIISMQKGGDIKSVFERLARAQEMFEKQSKLAYNDHLGYGTTCPTNLGTGLRASVMVKLPKLMANKPQFDEIAKKYNVQIRGKDGEHSDQSSGIYDISNRRRLGIKETALVMDMYNGVKAMIEFHKTLP